MAKSGKDKKGTSEDKPEDYSVGRGRPPEHTKFKKGTSGNPGGRPRGSKNLKTLIYNLAKEEVVMKVGGEKRKMFLSEAAARKFWDCMMQGDYRYVKHYFDIEAEMEILRDREGDRYKYSAEALHRLLYSTFTGDMKPVEEFLDDKQEYEERMAREKAEAEAEAQMWNDENYSES